MRLHLHLSIWCALMACAHISYADYTWNYTNDTGTYTASDWNTQSNWTGITSSGKGPQYTSNVSSTSTSSQNYDPIIFNNGQTIVFSGLALEGWNTRVVVQDGTTVTLSGQIRKIQSATTGTNNAYLKVDSTSKLIWDLACTGKANSGGTMTLDVQNYQGLDIRQSFNSDNNNNKISALSVSLGTLGSIISVGSAVSSATSITFNNTLLLQSWEADFDKNAGQYTHTDNLEDGYVLYTRKLWEISNETTSIGGSLQSSSSSFTLNSGATLTAASATLTASAANENKFYLYKDTINGNIYVQYVTKLVTGDSTWESPASGKWSDASNWTTSSSTATVVPSSSSTVAKFVNGENTTVTVDQSVAPNAISISGMSYTFVSANSGVISGSGKVTVDVSDKVTMSLANTYTGGTTVTNGTLVVTMANALGTGAVRVESGGILQIDVTGNTSAAVSGGMNIYGGTLAFKTGSHILNQTIQGSAGNILVSGSGTSLSITSAQANTALTTVTNGGSLTLNKNGSGQYSILYGNLNVTDGSTLITTGGDSFGYNNPESGGFGTLTLSGNSIWNVTNSNTTMGNTTIVLDSSKIALNCGTNNSHGLDLFYGTNTIRTTSSAAGMSSIVLANGAVNSGNKNSVNLRAGTVVFDVNRSTAFQLDSTNTADLKIDVSLAHKTDGGGTGFTKTGDGVMQITKASTVQKAVQIQNGTILLTNDGTLGTSSVTMGGSTGGSAKLAFRYDQEKTFANVISGTGTVTQEGAGNVILTGANTSSSLVLNLANSNSTVQLGTTGTASTWGGTVTGNGTLTLVNGTLSQAVMDTNVKLAVNASNASINAGGTDGSRFSSIVLGQNCRLTNVTGDITVATGKTETLTLTIDTANIGTGIAGTTSVIDHGSGTLYLNDSSKVLLNLASVQGLQNILETAQSSGNEVWITLSSGNLTCSNLSGITLSGVSLSDYGLALSRVQDGSLVLAQVPEPSLYAMTLLSSGSCLFARRRRV